MADRKERHLIPELDNTQQHQKGACRLTLITTKDSRGRLWSYARVSWLEGGYEIMGLTSDFSKTYLTIGGIRATQAAVNRWHKQAFDGKLDQIKAEVIAYYASGVHQNRRTA